MTSTTMIGIYQNHENRFLYIMIQIIIIQTLQLQQFQLILRKTIKMI